MVAKRLDELARITGPGAIAGLVVTALGSDDSYYLCWKTKAGTYKQDSRNLPPRLQRWLFPADGSTRHLASLQVVLGRDGGFVASDCDGKIEGKAEPRRLERASTLPLSQPAAERKRGGVPPPSMDMVRASSARLARPRASTLPSPKLASDGTGQGSVVFEGRDGARDTSGTLWMMKGLGGTMSTRASTMTIRKTPLFEQSSPTNLNSPRSSKGGTPVATTVPLPWDMPLQRRRGSMIGTGDTPAAIEFPLSPASTKSVSHQRKRSLASSTMFTSSAHAGRIPRLQSPTKAVPLNTDRNAGARQTQSPPVLEEGSSQAGSLPSWERPYQQRASPLVSPTRAQPSQVMQSRPSRPLLPPIDTTVGSSPSTLLLSKSPKSPTRPPTPVVPARRETKRRLRRTMTGPDAPAPLRLLGRPPPTDTVLPPALLQPEGEVPTSTSVVQSILKPTSSSPITQSPSLTRVPLNFTRRSRGASGSLDMTRVRTSIANSVGLAAVDRGTSPIARQGTQRWPIVDAGQVAGGKCFCNCHDGSFVVDAGVQVTLPSPQPSLPQSPRPPQSSQYPYSDAGIQTDSSPVLRQRGPSSYGAGPPKRSQVHWADWEVDNGSEYSSDEDFDGREIDDDATVKQPAYMGRMTDYFRSPQYSLGDALG